MRTMNFRQSGEIEDGNLQERNGNHAEKIKFYEVWPAPDHRPSTCFLKSIELE